MAVLCALISYLSIFLTEAAVFDSETLKGNMNILQESTQFPVIIVIGILISTASSALGAIFGGSRVLQALATDKLFPGINWLGKGSEKSNEPRRAVIMTWFIAQLGMFIGNLDVVAPIISSFFCLSYAITNFSACLLKASGTPNFRPTFKYFNAYVALIGGLLNIGIMFWLNMVYAFISLFFLLAIYIYLWYNAPSVEWGDVSQALIFHQIRKFLLHLDEKKSSHGKLWRPSILLMVDNLDNPLVDHCNRMKKGGLYILAGGIVGNFEDSFELSNLVKNSWSNYCSAKGIKAFSQITVAPSPRVVFQNLLLLSGLGAMTPNLVVIPLIDIRNNKKRNNIEKQSFYRRAIAEMEIGEYFKPHFLNELIEHQVDYFDMYFDVVLSKKSLLIAANFEKSNGSLTIAQAICFIDVWILESDATSSWTSFSQSSLILIQLAHIMTRSRHTSRSKIRVHRVVDHSTNVQDECVQLKSLISDARIDVADVLIYSESDFVDSECTSPLMKYCDQEGSLEGFELINLFIKEKSVDADLIFISLPGVLQPFLDLEHYKRPDSHEVDSIFNSMKTLTMDLPPTFLVKPAVHIHSQIMSRDI